MSYPANYLYIVSETNMVSAELLSRRLQVDGIVNFWENNSFKKQDAIPVSLEVLEETAHKISLEAIGIATGSNVNMPIKFNFMSAAKADGMTVDDPKNLCMLYLVIKNLIFRRMLQETLLLCLH